MTSATGQCLHCGWWVEGWRVNWGESGKSLEPRGWAKVCGWSPTGVAYSEHLSAWSAALRRDASGHLRTRAGASRRLWLQSLPDSAATQQSSSIPD